MGTNLTILMSTVGAHMNHRGTSDERNRHYRWQPWNRCQCRRAHCSAWDGVILTYNTNPRAAATVVERIEHVGGKAVALKLDVSDVGSFEAFRQSVVLTLRNTWNATTLGGLVNNAGYGLFNPLATVT